MIYILSLTTRKDLNRNLRTFQGKMKFKDFQGLPLKFKVFSRLCKLWYIDLKNIPLSVQIHEVTQRVNL